MSLKKRFARLLFRTPSEELPDEELHTEQESVTEPVSEFLQDSGPDPTLLELPEEHPLYRLYELRRKEAGYLPTPRLSLDDSGSLSEKTAMRERSRLKTAITGMCIARQKQIGGKIGKNEEQNEDLPDLDALPGFFLSADRLFAWVLVLPPVGNGAGLSREMLYQALRERGITYGLDTQLADQLAHNSAKYFHLFLIAKGKPAFDGTNGNIVDNYPREAARVMEVDEFDRVDYTHLNLIHNVKQGEEICHLIEPTEGEPGRTVLDEEIPAKSGKAVPLPMGRNTEISEDGKSLLASISGDVEFTGRSFQVKPVLDIPGNVDFSTGNIHFLGDVNIRGDVLCGFTVRAMGNIQVGGVVEAGSTVEADGDLIVVKGILGDGNTIIRSHRSIFAKFIENSTVYAQENIQTDCIMNSQIYSDGEVLALSGRGAILGGRIWAAKRIGAKAVGSQSECKTAVSLGGLPCTNYERDVLQRELKTLESDMERLECQLDSSSRSSLLEKKRLKLTTTELKLKQLENELADIRMMAEGKNDGRLECGVIYPGTEISFGDTTLRLRQESRQCVATLAYGEILLM